MKTIFNDSDFSALFARVEGLRPDSPRQWGDMNAAQMMAHTNRTIELSLGMITAPSESNIFLRWIIKPIAIGRLPIKKHSPTAKAMCIIEEKDFQAEKLKLLENLLAAKARGLSGAWKPHVAFGPLTPEQWGTLTYKHLDHHLQQFSA